jgi:hypothetical protein
MTSAPLIAMTANGGPEPNALVVIILGVAVTVGVIAVFEASGNGDSSHHLSPDNDIDQLRPRQGETLH